MSKELTLLEVSKQLEDFVLEFVKNGLDRKFIRGSFDIIETALKEDEKIDALDLEFIKSLHDGSSIIVNTELAQIYFKKLKALEIIAKKGIDIIEIKCHRKAKTYNEHTKRTYVKEYTEEEFQLVKEIIKEYEKEN